MLKALNETREAYQRRKGDDDRSVLCLRLPPQSKGKREV